MRKIKLSVESLRVESFVAADAVQGKGTIVGNAKTIDTCFTNDPVGCGSAIDLCHSSPHSATLPCNGCVDTELC